MAGETTLIRDASANAASMRLLAEDVACLLFPHTGETPSEELQASVRLALHMLVSGIETELGVSPQGALPESWDMLSRSGLLRETSLIDYCLARIAETRIRARIEADGLRTLGQLPAQLLHHENPLLADAARNILMAETLSRSFDARALVGQMPPELLHPLAWRVVAVLKTKNIGTSGSAGHSLIDACHSMLAGRGDSALLQTAAAKLVYFLPEGLRGELYDPLKAGLPMFAAALSARTTVAADLIFRFFDAEAPASALIVLRAAGLEPANAEAAVRALCRARAIDSQLGRLMEDYGKCTVEEASGLCLSFSARIDDQGQRA